MIFICVKFETKPEWTHRFMELTADFTAATRAEPGNKWFEWSRSVDEESIFTLVEAFEDDAAGDHVNSAHFQQAMKDMLPALERTPQIFNTQVDQDDWSEMGELRVE